MTRIFAIALIFTAAVSVATSVEARRAISANGASLNGASASVPLAIIAIELPRN